MESKETVFSPADHALLEELLLSQKQELRHARVGSVVGVVLAAALLAALLVLVPRAVRAMDSVETSLAAVNALVDEANALLAENADEITEAAAKLGELDLDSLNAAIGDFSDMGRRLNAVDFDSLNEAVSDLSSMAKKLDGVDFDTLNKAIQDLSDIVEPLARVSNLFR